MSVEFPEGPWLMERARALEIEAQAPKPILQGRHLIELGYAPSPAFKKILDAAYDAQMEGSFKEIESGRAWLKKYLKTHPQGT
jgi:tRNA nucleotidyltransferase (CCA-adding enzyme)